MKPRFTLFRRGWVFYAQDTTTGHQTSLRTRDEGEARALLNSKNEAHRQPVLNLQIARTYLAAADPQIAKRTWQKVMDEMGKTKHGPTKIRHDRAMRDAAFDIIRNMPLLETQAHNFLHVLSSGTVSTNVFLVQLHNFALQMSWLPWPILAKKSWPKLSFQEKRGVTWDEHQQILAHEQDAEKRAFFECCWHLGGAQTDIASLTSENIDWRNRLVSFYRRKTGTPSIVRFGDALDRVLRELPRFGPLFPSLIDKPATDRSRIFRLACRRVRITGVTLHSYRYAWAERAKSCGYPERFAQEALGHQSKAVHRAYSRKAQVTLTARLGRGSRPAAISTAVHSDSHGGKVVVSTSRGVSTGRFISTATPLRVVRTLPLPPSPRREFEQGDDRCSNGARADQARRWYSPRSG